jgi:Zn-dependent alcohol dehydrogenase
LAALLGAHASGANPLIALDVAAHKFELARELGATHCINAADADAIDQLRELAHGGVQFAIESVGSERVLAQAYAATRHGGTTVTVGLPSPDRMLSVPALSLVTEERTIKGSYMGSAVPSRDVPRFIALYRAGHLPVDRMLTHRLQLDEINTGFDRLSRAETIRQVVLL